MRSSIPLVLLLSGCRFEPEPPLLPGRPAATPTAASSSSAAASAALAALPPTSGPLEPVVHLRLTAPRAVSSASVALVAGAVSDVALRGLRDGRLPASTLARVVPSWMSVDGSTVTVIPSVELAPGTTYTLAVGALGERWPLEVSSTMEVPVMARLWPPPGEVSGRGLGVFCGDGEFFEELTPEGFGPEAEVSRGAAGWPAPGCVTVEVRAGSGPVAWPVGLRSGDARVAALDPSPLRRGARTAPATLTCEPGEVQLGPGCLAPLDDRALWRLPPEPWLRLDAGPRVLTGGWAVVRGLVPQSSSLVTAALLDLSGQEQVVSAQVTTLAPRPHVVVSEVLADALGPEPSSEWVELYNDGAEATSLEGWTLEDAQGAIALPAVSLEPSGYLLLTNDGFTSGEDVAPAAGCAVVSVGKLGKGGLSNQGEALVLRDALGREVSRAPALRPKAGRSVQRRHPDDPDDDLTAFTLSPAAPTPCAANVP